MLKEILKKAKTKKSLVQLSDPVTCKVAVNNQPFIKVITAFSNPLSVQKVGEGPVLSCRDSEVTLKVVVFSFFFFLHFTVSFVLPSPFRIATTCAEDGC